VIAAKFAACVPQLESARLTLRASRLEDFDDYASIVCTQRGKFVGGPMSREDGWYDFVGYIANWLLHGHGGWTVVETTSDRRLGFVALGLEPGDQEVELGYIFLESAEGQGFAREAVERARAFGFDVLNLPSLVSYIDKENTRSIQLCQALGAVDDTPADWLPTDVVYRHNRRVS
jgi:RimJ/RimL family protein N-acetyltransferase